MSRIAGLTSIFDADDRIFQRVAGRVGITMTGLQARVGASINFIRTGFLGLGAGFASVAAVLGFSAKQASDAEGAQARLAAVLKASGNAAGFSTSQLQAFAKQMQGVTKFEDDATVGALAMLATFRNITGENFTGAAKAAMNLATITGRDLPAAMQLVGKALNDPKRGLSALQRAGVAFTDQQRKQITALAELGFSFRAQQIILRQVERSYGGAAEAAGRTFAGQLSILKHQLGDVAEDLGSLLLPHLAKFVGWIRSFIPAIAGWVAQNGVLDRSLKEMGFTLANLPDIASLALLKTELAFTKFGDAGKYLLTEQFPAYFKVFSASMGMAFTGAGVMAATAAKGIEDQAGLISSQIQGLLVGMRVATGVISGQVGATVSGLKTGMGVLATKVGGLEPQKENPQVKALQDQIKALTEQLKKNHDDATRPTPAKTGAGMDPFAAFRQMRDNLMDTIGKVAGVTGGAIGKLLEAFWKEAGRRAKIVEPRVGGFTGLAEMHRTLQQAAISDPTKQDRHLAAQEKGNVLLNKLVDFAERWIKSGGRPIVQ